jgi:hypothetical protein
MGISGIRGYAPHSFQKIKFMKPLTLISGQNGSGKTVIFLLFLDNHLMFKIHDDWNIAAK